MNFTRREFGKLALAAAPAAALLEKSLFGAAQARPNSKIAGVQIGTITYSYRSMPDQSAEATLKYTVDSGISGIEMMGDPVDAWAREKSGFQPSVARGRGFGGGRGLAPQGPLTGSWNGVACALPREGGGDGGGGRGSAAPTPEQIAAAAELRKWQQGLSMQIFKDLRKLYNDAGVNIYAVKNLNLNGTDEDLEFEFAVAKALGVTHVTAELPAPSSTSTAMLKRIGDFALKHGVYAAYHTHLQGSMTAFEEAFTASKGNRANIDFGHYVAAGEVGGTPMDFLNKYHDRVASFHLKERTLPKDCALNLPWGTGETPIKEVLRLVRDKKWDFPATIEMEYDIPQGSDAVKEVAKCLRYCKDALLS